MLKIKKIIRYKKVHKKTYALAFSRCTYKKEIVNLHFGSYGLKAVESGCLTFKQLEAARRCITRFAGRRCKIWIRVFPERPGTQKGKGVRMGKGVGAVKFWYFDLKAGHIIFEVENTSLKIIWPALKAAGKKLPIKTKFLAV